MTSSDTTNLWFEITAHCRPDEVEPVSAIMRSAAPGGVSIEEPIEPLGPELGYRVRDDARVAVRAYIPSSELGAMLTQQLREAMAAFPDVELVAKPVYEQDWAVSWREFFGTVRVGRIAIVPSWVEHVAAPHEVIVRLDPGRAFGTGHHETTRLCLAALQDIVRPGMSILDLGTGSGILSIAAAKLGAHRVLARDIDPAAVEVARQNIADNGAGDCVTVEKGSLESEAPLSGIDAIVANISTHAHVSLASAYAATLAPGGRLALSGILSADSALVTGAVERAGFERTAARYERDWCLLEFRRC
ncbi:MAG: 50S ribosomal protein L11 methyltransferase [Dehalococcoidia bacterium]